MTKFKLLELTAEQPILRIAELLNERQFLRGRATGVELTDVQKTCIRGKFIEEIIANEVVIDPFGEEILNSVRRYSIFDFLIIPLKKNRFLIRINNPPRSLKSFISILSDALGFGFTVVALEIDILAMIQHLRALSSTRCCTIKKVRMANIYLSESSLAKIEVASKGDAYHDLQERINITDAMLERATVELKEGSVTSEVEFISKGIIAGDLKFLEELTPTFQSYFS